MKLDETETTDEVLASVRRTKERLAAAMGFDIKRILDDARSKQGASGHPVVSPPAKQAPSVVKQRAVS